MSATFDTLEAESPRVYWTIRYPGEKSDKLAELAGLKPCKEVPGGELCIFRMASAKDLMTHLKGMGRRVSQFSGTEFQFARMEITRDGYNLVAFPNYGAALEADMADSDDATDLPCCPFCHLTDRLEILNWANERADGSEYQGDAVRCNRCDAIAPAAAWKDLPGNAEMPNGNEVES